MAFGLWRFCQLRDARDVWRPLPKYNLGVDTRPTAWGGGAEKAAIHLAATVRRNRTSNRRLNLHCPTSKADIANDVARKRPGYDVRFSLPDRMALTIQPPNIPFRCLLTSGQRVSTSVDHAP